MKEKRKAKRYNVAYPVEAENSSSEAGIKLLDLSKGGISFKAEKKFLEKEVLNIRLFLKSRMFNLKSVVVHAKKIKDDLYAIGASFHALPEEFMRVFEKEIDEISHIHKERQLSTGEDFSFEEASRLYLGDNYPF